MYYNFYKIMEFENKNNKLIKKIVFFNCINKFFNFF